MRAVLSQNVTCAHRETEAFNPLFLILTHNFKISVSTRVSDILRHRPPATARTPTHPLRPDPLAARPGRFDSFPPPHSPCPAGRAHRAHRGPCCSASAAIAKPWFLPGPVTMRDAEAQDWPSLRAEIAVSRPAGCQPLPVPVDRVASGTGTNGRASHGRASAPWRQGEYLLLPGISAAFSAAPRWRP